MMYDRDTCGDVNCCDTGSLESIGIQSSDDFMANLLHLKCKVIQLARRQMQKEIPGLPDLGMKLGYLGMNVTSQRPNVSRMGGKIAENGDKTNRPEKPMIIKKQEAGSPPVATMRSGSAIAPNSLVDWMKRILTTNLPFYWIIFVVGMLGFTTLVCGIFLGAFICTNGSRSFPFFFWSKSRVGRPVY